MAGNENNVNLLTYSTERGGLKYSLYVSRLPQKKLPHLPFESKLIGSFVEIVDIHAEAVEEKEKNNIASVQHEKQSQSV
jgi:hypothetical protein